MAQFEVVTEAQKVVLRCSGPWNALELGPVVERLENEVLTLNNRAIEFDLDGVTQMDSAGALLFQGSQSELEAGGNTVTFCNVDEAKERVLRMVREHAHPGAVFEAKLPGTLESIGRATVEYLGSMKGLLAFIGETFLSFARVLRTPGTLRWKETMFQINESAIKALWIIALTMFLVGIVVAYQSSVQLKIYGANIFIVDMLGISILRELAPMLTAIVVAGRSGSAYAAQIGVMKMTEEIDAMRTMGFDPFAFLVLPRMLALVIMMPILIFFADIVGVIGGMVVANIELELTSKLFLDRFVEVIALKHFWVGIIKGPFFAILIAAIGIYRGLQVKNDTESIGFNTTKSVVEAIFAVIICDALFSIIFTNLGF